MTKEATKEEEKTVEQMLDEAYNLGIDHAVIMVHGNFMLAGFDKEIKQASESECKTRLINQLSQLKKQIP